MWDPASKQRAAVIPTDGNKVIVAVNKADDQYLLPGGSPEVGRTYSLGPDATPLRTAAREYLEESYKGFKKLSTSDKLSLITKLEKQLQYKGVEITGDVTTYIYGLPVDDVGRYLKTLSPSSDVSKFKIINLDTLTFKEPSQLSPYSQPTNLFNQIFRPMSGYREDTSWILNKYFKTIPSIDATLKTLNKAEKTELINEATAWFKSSESPYKSKWYSLNDFSSKEILQEYLLNQQGLSGFPVHTWGGTKPITDMYYNPQVKGWQFVSRDSDTGKILEQAAKWKTFQTKGINFEPGYYEMTYGAKGVQIKPLELGKDSIFSPPKEGDLARLTFSVNNVDPNKVHVEWVESSQAGSGKIMMEYLKSVSQGKTITLTDATIGDIAGIKNYDITGKKIVFDLDNTLVGKDGQVRPNVIKLLDKLRDNDNELILWTHSKADRTTTILGKTGLKKYFNKVITREDYENPLLGENTIKNIKSIGADLLIDNRQANVDAVLNSGGNALKISTYKYGGSDAFNNLWAKIGERIGQPIVKGKLDNYYTNLGFKNIGSNAYQLNVPNTIKMPDVPIMVGITGCSRYDVPFDTVSKYQAAYQPIGHATSKSPTALFGWGEFETIKPSRGQYFYTQPPYVAGGKLSPEFLGIHYLDIGKSSEYPVLGFKTGEKAFIQFGQPIGTLGTKTSPVTAFTGTPKDIPRGVSGLVQEFEYGTLAPGTKIEYVSGKGWLGLTFGRGQEMINVAGYPVGLPYARVVPSVVKESGFKEFLELLGGEKITPSVAGPALITIPTAGLLATASELISKPETIAPIIKYTGTSITEITGGENKTPPPSEGGGFGKPSGGGGGSKPSPPSVPEIPTIPEIPIIPEEPLTPEVPRYPEKPKPYEFSRPYEKPLPGLLPPSSLKEIVTKGKKKILKTTKGYKVEVRRRRKFRVESPFALPKEEALSFGVRRTLGSAAATFRLVPTEETARSLGLQAPSGKAMQYFRTPKTKVPQPLTFVQKERMRITTPGEKREITYAGIRASATRIKSPKPKATTFKKIRNKSLSTKYKGGKQKWF
jgi:hypothetical protein